MLNIQITVAKLCHIVYAKTICTLMKESAKQRGTGIAKRTPHQIAEKIIAGKAVIAVCGEDVVGFCYTEAWSDGQFSSNSGLIVNPKYRGMGVARKLKAKAFKLARELYPNAQLFGLTTSLPVLKINHDLGYKPVTFSLISQDEQFWEGCKGCVNHDILMRTGRKHCLCTAMLYIPESSELKAESLELKTESLALNQLSIAS